jgi:farnesyl diphosphate synthase
MFATGLLTENLALYRARHDAYMKALLQPPVAAQQLANAMSYATLLGGKRVRPFLVYATGSMLGVADDVLDAPAAAIECIHAYSLVHDDLPAMDNDSLRRGQATCHIQFDEATAILAGDALQSLAFQLLAKPQPQINAEQQLAMVTTLAEAAGLSGMCGGQALDINATGSNGEDITVGQLEQIHRLKTGALLRAAVRLGALCSNNVSDEVLTQLDEFASAIGLAFQVQDDILDVIGDTQTLGKTKGADADLSKATYPALLGLDGSKQLLATLHKKALHALSLIPYNTELLEEFTEYLVTRDR